MTVTTGPMPFQMYEQRQFVVFGTVDLQNVGVDSLRKKSWAVPPAVLPALSRAQCDSPSVT